MKNLPLITGMGAALVDLFADVSDEQLAALGSPKASMSLIDAARSRELQAAVKTHTQRPGGSTANAIAGIGALGRPAGFIGNIGDDDLGRIFADSFQATGVRFACNQPNPASAPTGHCVVLVTPDGERTMHTVLGASVTISADDLRSRQHAQLLADTGLLFGEGYLFDTPSTRTAFLTAAKYVRTQGGRVALSLSDALCVARHRDDFLALLAQASLDIVLANKAEAATLFETDNIEQMIAGYLAHKCIGAITLSAQGAIAIDNQKGEHIPALPNKQIVDVTGAGDQFAAGFLSALVNGKTPSEGARIGVVAASEVIGHFGPRPLTDIRLRLAAHGLST